jgi:beta-glucosidase
VKELRGYQRVSLKPGERRLVTFEIRDEFLSFPGPDFRPVVEPGEFEVMIGPDSGNLQKAKFSRL